MNWNVDAAIFDMDGTLLDTMRYWRYTTLEFLLAHGLPVRDEDLLRMHDTSSRRFLLDYAAREGLDFGPEREMIAELEGYMNRHYLYDAKLKPGVPELLDRLIGRGLRLCVATGSPREYARNGLGRLGVLDRFLWLLFDELRILPDFGSGQPTVEDRVSCRVSAQALFIVLAAVRVLYEFWRKKVLDIFL